MKRAWHHVLIAGRHLGRAWWELRNDMDGLAWAWDRKLVDARCWLDDRRAALRPGLAPELSHPWCSPWLSRTAGQPIAKPNMLDVFVARMAVQVEILQKAMGTLTEPMRQATASAVAFSRAVANIRLAKGSQA